MFWPSFVLSSFLVLGMFAGVFAHSEAWLSNRYAQNCASCHAPGRLNKPAAGRRCTLSCQGCHVNPQGGGMRNQYGIWNQQRWLRSSRTALFRDKPAPAPLEHQPYYERMRELASQAKEYYKGKRPRPLKRAQSKASSNKSSAKGEKRQRGPYQIRYVSNPYLPENLFDQHSYQEWFAVIESERDFLSAIPEGDPYRLERELGVYTSGNLRYFALQSSRPQFNNKNTAFSFMGADIGVRMRPTRYHQLSGVIEARFANAPTNQNAEDVFVSGRGTAFARSAYLLVDDLAYNSYVQYGLYRPMFGHMDPDHNSLASEISGLTQNAVYKGVSVGTAPNVPFLVANYLMPQNQFGSNEYLTSSGYVVTGGARFVSYGASATASLWSTNFRTSGVDKKRDMIALAFGGTIGKYIGNFEFLRAQVSAANGAKNAGTVFTLYNKFRIWRENYAVLNFAQSNVSNLLSPGKASELTIGFKSFPIGNLELEGLYVMRSNTASNVKTDTNMVQIQTHMFF